jgi:hypothetical protein
MAQTKEEKEKYINRKKEIDDLIIAGKVKDTDNIYKEYKIILKSLKKNNIDIKSR